VLGQLLPEVVVPKLHCPCGYLHNLSPIPDAGWKPVRDRDYEMFIEAKTRIEMTAGGHPLDAAEVGRLRRAAVSALGLLCECPDCGRIMWKRDGEDHYRIYTPEGRAE
jgi:hypothetical protein